MSGRASPAELLGKDCPTVNPFFKAVLLRWKKRYDTIMKIERTGSARPSSPVKSTGKASKSSGERFSEALDQSAGSVAGVSGAAPSQAVDALLSIQEVDDAIDGNKRQGQRWGESILEKLEMLRIGLIGGVIPSGDLETITKMVEEGRGEVTDPGLNEILDEIELRARVELAKLRR
ncbi:MAG: flagellar assembly protein FliX [Rhodospirillaceae bacterium]|nr:flagellar assembly protein FliX [Rhodospirillaceae bacterium]